MDTAAAALLPDLLAEAGLPPDPERDLVRQVAPYSGVWRLSFPQRGGETVIYKHAWAPLDGEHVALGYAARRGLPVPRVLAARVQDRRLGFLMTDLGQPARQATDAEAARIAAAMHQLPGPKGLPALDAAELAAMPARIASRAAEHGMPRAIAAAASLLAEHARRIAAPAVIPPFGLGHSEFHPESTHISPDGSWHVFDLARAYRGPGLIDLASWQGTQGEPDPPATRALIDAYVEAGGHPSALDLRAGVPAEHWALGMHRIWAVDWFAEQVALGWVGAGARPRYHDAMLHYLTTAVALLGL
jgi:hypothetical protein